MKNIFSYKNAIILAMIATFLETSCKKDDSINIPQTVVLNSPVNGANSVNRNPNFQWGAIANADAYDIQVSTHGDFSYIYENNATTTNSFKNSSKNYENNQYFWRVRAKNKAGRGNWSDVFTFFVDQNSPGGNTTQLEWAYLLFYDSGIINGDETKLIFYPSGPLASAVSKTFTCAGTVQTDCDYEGDACAYWKVTVYATLGYEISIYHNGTYISSVSGYGPSAGNCKIIDVQDL